MKVLHCVTLVSPVGEFGGPLRVAINLSKEQNRAGSVAEIAAAARGYYSFPAAIEGVTAHVYPVRVVWPAAGFSGMVSVRLLTWAISNLHKFDVVHVHLARDLVTLPLACLALLFRRRLIVQTHGMVDGSSRFSAKLLDLLLTKTVLRRASAVLHLSPEERKDLCAVFGVTPNYRELKNGISLIPQVNSSVTVAGKPLDVVFLARMSPRKRPLMFIDIAEKCIEEGIDATFTLIGPDEGEGDKLNNRLADKPFGERIKWVGPMPPSEVGDRLSRASVLVNTTEYDPFPMAVLEALSVGTPVVIGRSSPLSSYLERYRAGAAVTETIDGFVRALKEIGGRDDLLEEYSANAISLSRDEFDIRIVADRLYSIYEGN